MISETGNKPEIPRRASALDALRGFAILTMVLSGVVPYGELPRWMYHAQTPPPTHAFDPSVPGITWVDLVFPFFIFAMGAAFPFALSRRLDSLPKWRVLAGILERGFLLGTFAIFLAHIRPYAISSEPTTGTWLLAMAGFTLLCGMYTRLPGSWPAAARWAVKLAGWGGAVLFLLLVWRGEEHRFDPARSDIIIIILTNVAVFGALFWLVSRRSVMVRLWIMAALVAMRLSAGSGGWIGQVWSATLVPHVIHVGMASYALVALAGSICGDLLLGWMRSMQLDATALRLDIPAARLWGVAGVMTGFIVVCLAGLLMRELFATTVLCVALSVAGWWLLRPGEGPTASLLRALFQWGVAWLMIGLLFEPYEGGIKKDPATFSYFFVTAGLAAFLLIAFVVVLDVMRLDRWAGVLVANGQNPMIAYVAHGNLVLPLMNLTGLGLVIDRLTPGPWLDTGRGLLITAMVAVIVWGFTRWRVYWRT